MLLVFPTPFVFNSSLLTEAVGAVDTVMERALDEATTAVAGGRLLAVSIVFEATVTVEAVGEKALDEVFHAVVDGRLLAVSLLFDSVRVLDKVSPLSIAFRNALSLDNGYAT
jgi:hypothetical protein